MTANKKGTIQASKQVCEEEFQSLSSITSALTISPERKREAVELKKKSNKMIPKGLLFESRQNKVIKEDATCVC